MAATPPAPVSDPPSAISSKVDSAVVTFFSHRMSAWLWVSVALLFVLFYFARHMIMVEVYNVAKATIAGYIAYALSLAIEGCLKGGNDRAPRPHQLRDQATALRQPTVDVSADTQTPPSQANLDRAWQLDQLAAAMLWRRAMIVSACVLASGLGG